MSNFTIDNNIPNPVLTVSNTNKNSVTFLAQNSELLKVCDDGFYVRGKKLEIDDDEAKSVYKALREFLIWAALTRS